MRLDDRETVTGRHSLWGEKIKQAEKKNKKNKKAKQKKKKKKKIRSLKIINER